MREALFLFSVVFANVRPVPVDTVVIGDLEGTNGRWQTGRVTVAAPAKEVELWLSDYSAWATRFPDIESSQILGVTADGRTIVRFHSRVLGRTMTIRTRTQGGLIAFDGTAKNVSAQGRIYISPGEHGTTVIMQATAKLHGLPGAVATDKMKRDRAIAKLRADLTALVQLSRTFASTHRHGT